MKNIEETLSVVLGRADTPSPTNGHTVDHPPTTPLRLAGIRELAECNAVPGLFLREVFAALDAVTREWDKAIAKLARYLLLIEPQ